MQELTACSPLKHESSFLKAVNTTHTFRYSLLKVITEYQGVALFKPTDKTYNVGKPIGTRFNGSFSHEA